MHRRRLGGVRRRRSRWRVRLTGSLAGSTWVGCRGELEDVVGGTAHNGTMNVIAIALGVFAIFIVLLTGILPVIGALFAWVALTIGVIGLIFGLLSKRTNGRNIAILACVLAALRLVLGGLIL
jgi:hypothetical protein